ncbi:MAG: EAL domain-containing protein [Gammaproteobacteria bacterium]|nr:EAL domain-containing protein [Gammaproteobacteria bacterium]MDH3374501.1 EAL domain-containing protein [Gammaproteobacteria bacterium]MDH3408823.1 EAL domain-containing protein [Gammaproteobacteria bacterium]
MHKELRDKIKHATEASGIEKPDFLELLSLIDQHYDKMEATITQSLTSTTPIEAIFDSVTEALLSVSESGIVCNCNKICSHYFGLTKDQLIGSKIEHILPAAKGRTVAEFVAPFTSNLDASQLRVETGRIEAVRANGDVFIAELNASELQAGGGRIFVISLHDVTGRQQAESALKENEERYRALVENAPEAIVVFDIDENLLVDANDPACELFNLSRSRLLSIGPEAISPEVQPDGTPSFGVDRGYVEKALNGGHPTFEWTHQDSKGREFPCEVRFSRLPAGEKRLIRASITDITERKRNETITFAQNKILEMIAASRPHDRTLRAICRSVEKIGDGFRAAIMQFDNGGGTISVAEAPSLPEPLKVFLNFVEVSADSITCGSAVHRGEERFTTNIAIDPAWKSQWLVAEEHGIAAVWSFLVHGARGRVIGTLDVYVDAARAPGTDELDKLSRMARLAGIAIKRQLDEEKLRSSEMRYRGLFENVVDGVYIASRDGELIAANPALVDMLGYESVEELKAVGRTTMLYVNPVDRERVFARLEAEGIIKNFEYRLRRKDGREIVVLENSRAVYDENGNIAAHEGTITDITERKRAETRVFEEKERAQITLQSIGDGVITTDADGRIDYINPVAQDLTGWDMRSARGKPINEIMTIINEHTRATVDNPVMRCLKEGRVISLEESSILIARNSEEVPVQDSAAPIRDRIGNVIGCVMVFHDVSKETRLFRQLSYQASHDSLTDLINRREFENRLITALDNIRGKPENAHALLYLDLDQFKVVNDTFGHPAGDALLRQLSDIVHANIRSTDVLARLGGDEFGILLERCDEQRAIAVAEAIRSAVEGYRFEWQDSFTTIRCSIGVVMVTSDNADVAGLMSSADVACYSAKDMGRNQVHLYRDSDASMRHEEMKWVSRISSAVEEDRLELFFQPIIGIGKGKGKSRGHYELLLRMRDEGGELVSPNQFIPAAERYNLMSTLDRWVIREALSKLADRNTDGEARYTLAINLSGTSLSEDRFLEYVIKELEAQQLPPGAICFEITETAAISNLSRVIHFMQALKKLGCKFSLDDFGSGLSSFTYLKNLPVDYLKIDGHFIRNVVDDSVDESMVKAISQVGHAMGIETIAERVETKQVLDKLGALGIEFAQGYYIARPASVRTFEPWGDHRFAAVQA